MKIGYARVSTQKQELDVQLDILRKENCDTIYKEKYTGTKMDRPEFNKVLSYLSDGDVLVVTKLDRLARNIREGIDIIDGLFKRNVKVHVLNFGLLENTTMGRFFLQTMLAITEMERNIILERMNAGREYNKANNPNYKEGRPNKFTKQQVEHALKLMENNSVKQVSNMTGISVRSLFLYKKLIK